MPILYAKLLTPHTSGALIREKLSPLMQEVTEKRITVVTAGAGYGKTTFVAQAVQGHDTAWYRLDSLDQDFAVFMSHLVAGIRRRWPDFGRETLKRLEDGETLGLEYQGVAAVFINEISRYRKDLMIVLDDYHTVQDSALISDTVQILSENLCPFAHLIIISRTEVPLQLSRLRIMREVMDVSQEDLVFAPEETRLFFRQISGISLTEESLKEVQEKTAGWVSALILFSHSLAQKNSRDIAQEIKKLKGSGRLISGYLAENVYALLGQEVREFLLKTSILSGLNALFCNRLLGISNSAKLLGRLQKSHLFTIALDEDGQEYCYHQLFREYLQAALDREMGYEEKERLHLRAALIMEESGETEEAVRHYLLAGAYGQACMILEKMTLTLIGTGRHGLMQSFLSRLPEPCFHSHPWLEYQRGFVHVFSGDYAAAGGSFFKALDRFRETQDQNGMDRCLNTMGLGLYLTGDFPAAENLFEELLRSPSLSPLLRVEALIHLVFINSQSGRLQESDLHYEQALQALPSIEEPELREGSRACLMLYHGFRHIVSGDMLKAIDLGEEAGAMLERLKSHRLLTVSYQLTSMAHAFLGSFEQGLADAMKGLSISKEKGYADVSYGWLLSNAGMNAGGLGRTEEALGYAQDSLRHFRKMGSFFGEGSACLTLGTIHLYAGRPDLAEEMAGVGLDSFKGLGPPYMTSLLKCLLATSHMLKGRIKEAEGFLLDAHAEYPLSTHFDALFFRIYALWHLIQGRMEEACGMLQKCLIISEANRYEGYLARETGLLMPLYVMLHAKGVSRDFIRKIFTLAGDGARQQLMDYQKTADRRSAQSIAGILKSLPEPSRPGLTVRCLGKFRVCRGTAEIPDEAWKSSKSRMLFKLLVHYRSRGYVSKEVFIEHLWPEDDPAKTSTRFHVALTTLRRILEPDLKRGSPSAYLKSTGDTYLLDLGKDGLADVDAFDQACTRAGTIQDEGRAIAYLFEAEQLYGGEFLAEDPYEQWCSEERDRIRERYLSVLAGIIDYFIVKKDYQKAADYCGKYLSADPFAEDIYRQLMQLHALSGNNSLVMKTYEKCRENIVTELGCPLSRRTLNLAKELLSSDAMDSPPSLV